MSSRVCRRGTASDERAAAARRCAAACSSLVSCVAHAELIASSRLLSPASTGSLIPALHRTIDHTSQHTSVGSMSCGVRRCVVHRVCRLCALVFVYSYMYTAHVCSCRVCVCVVCVFVSCVCSCRVCTHLVRVFVWIRVCVRASVVLCAPPTVLVPSVLLRSFVL